MTKQEKNGIKVRQWFHIDDLWPVITGDFSFILFGYFRSAGTETFVRHLNKNFQFNEFMQLDTHETV